MVHSTHIQYCNYNLILFSRKSAFIQINSSDGLYEYTFIRYFYSFHFCLVLLLTIYVLLFVDSFVLALHRHSVLLLLPFLLHNRFPCDVQRNGLERYAAPFLLFVFFSLFCVWFLGTILRAYNRIWNVPMTLVTLASVKRVQIEVVIEFRSDSRYRYYFPFSQSVQNSMKFMIITIRTIKN